MINVTFIDQESNKHELEVSPGASLMDAATENLVPGIEAECGGSCSCATCHVYIPEEWKDKVGGPRPTENILLEVLSSRQENSRLCCQVFLDEEHDGLVVEVAESF